MPESKLLRYLASKVPDLVVFLLLVWIFTRQIDALEDAIRDLTFAIADQDKTAAVQREVYAAHLMEIRVRLDQLEREHH